MKPEQFWLNFSLGDELSVSGAFIYNGLRRFHEMRKLDNTDEVFEVFYNLSVGLERLLKIAVVLLEYDHAIDQQAFEKSLITHSHLELLNRVKKSSAVNLAVPHNEFLGLLTRFYKSLRYDRYNLISVYELGKERDSLCDFLGKHLEVDLVEPLPLLGTPNDDRYRRFLRKIVLKITKELYEVIRNRSSELNLYTYELRYGSKAQTVFQAQVDIPSEDILWKELLIFMMNTDASSAYLEFLRSIPPLDFDPELIDEYLDCFQADSAKALVADELEAHYAELPDKGKRLSVMKIIANPLVSFDTEDEDAF